MNNEQILLIYLMIWAQKLPHNLNILLLYRFPSNFENFRIANGTRYQLPKPEDIEVKIIQETNVRKNHENVDNEENTFYSNKYSNINATYNKCKNSSHSIRLVDKTESKLG